MGIKELEIRLDNLQRAFIQAQKNQVPITQKTDETANKVDAITPFSATKTAYIDDSEVVFFDVPNGALLVSFSNGNMDFSIKRADNALRIEFEPLEEVVTITIKVQ